MTEPARCQNVVMKLGGMLNRLVAHDFRARPAPLSSTELAEYWRSDMGTYIELFGPERCMFESNFPVEKMGVGWMTLWSAWKRIAADVSPEEKRPCSAAQRSVWITCTWNKLCSS